MSNWLQSEKRWFPEPVNAGEENKPVARTVVPRKRAEGPTLNCGSLPLSVQRGRAGDTQRDPLSADGSAVTNVTVSGLFQVWGLTPSPALIRYDVPTLS